jgi:hypothetical protein
MLHCARSERWSMDAASCCARRVGVSLLRYRRCGAPSANELMSERPCRTFGIFYIIMNTLEDSSPSR